jgi:hypothetical protein
MPKAPAPPVTVQQPTDPVARVAVESDVRLPDDMAPLFDVPILFWVCPNGCGGRVGRSPRRVYCCVCGASEAT